MAAREIAGVKREVISRDEWQKARAALLALEKAHMKATDALAAERRRQPLMYVEKSYSFETPSGAKTSLLELFDGKRQLIVYQRMHHTCPGCAMFTDQVSDLRHLRQRDTNFVFVTLEPPSVTNPFRERMGWHEPWYRASHDFYTDFDVSPNGFGLNVFIREKDAIYRSYYTSDRGVEPLGTVWSLLDVTPLGRQETWENSPRGTPQTPAFDWWKLHDEYER